MARLSIIIPCPGDPVAFEDTLASVLANRPDDCEVLVPMPHPYDDPYALGDEVGFLYFPDARSTVALLAASLLCAKSPLIHVLQCGLIVEEGWTEAALAHFASQRDLGAVSLRWMRRDATITGVRVAPDGRRHFCTADVDAQRHGPWGPPLACGFYRRDLLRALEAFLDDVPEGLADAALAIGMAAVGAACCCDESVVRGEWEAPAVSAHVRGRTEEQFMQLGDALNLFPGAQPGAGRRRVGATRRQHGGWAKVAYLLGRRSTARADISILAEALAQAQTAWHKRLDSPPPATILYATERRAA